MSNNRHKADESDLKVAASQAPVVAKPAGAVISASAISKMKNAKPTDDFKAGDLMIPWLSLVQTSSGYMKRANENYIPEAREGDIIDTLSKRLRATQQVVLVKYETHYTTWAPGGGKLVKQWFTDPVGYNSARYPDGKNFGNKVDADGNEVKATPTYYILALNAETGAAEPMTMAWGSTQAKKVKRVNSLARADLLDEQGLPYIPPIYARIFDISSRGETGDDNKSWAGWVAEPGGLVLEHPRFGEMWWAKAEAFREQIEKGNVRPMAPQAGEEVADDDGGQPYSGPQTAQPAAASGKTLDDAIPF